MNHTTLSVLVDDRAGVLTRIAGLFARRGFNIASLAVGGTERPGISRMTIVVDGDDAVVEQVKKQLSKLVDVQRIEQLESTETLGRELMLVKVNTEQAGRAAVLEVAGIFRANIVDVSLTTVTLEMTGTGDKLQALYDLLVPFGIVELTRTGMIALQRGDKCICD